jgi:hypothetical protein
MNSVDKVVIIGIVIVGFVLGLGFGLDVGRGNTINAIRQSAAAAGAGVYKADQTTGKVSFYWVSNGTNNLVEDKSK